MAFDMPKMTWRTPKWAQMVLLFSEKGTTLFNNLECFGFPKHFTHVAFLAFQILVRAKEFFHFFECVRKDILDILQRTHLRITIIDTNEFVILLSSVSHFHDSKDTNRYKRHGWHCS